MNKYIVYGRILTGLDNFRPDCPIWSGTIEVMAHTDKDALILGHDKMMDLTQYDERLDPMIEVISASLIETQDEEI
jgi:hypothetical protein